MLWGIVSNGTGNRSMVAATEIVVAVTSDEATGGCWRGICHVPPTPSTGWIGALEMSRQRARRGRSALRQKQRAILASGSETEIACVAGEFINMSLTVAPQMDSE